MSLQNLLSGRDQRRSVAALSDHEAWQVYQQLLGYGVPPAEAQAVVDALAQRPTPDIHAPALNDA